MPGTKAIEGGCLCGGVRYRSKVPPGFAFHCYCLQCQRITGAGHASQFALPSDKVELTGEISRYLMTAESGNAVTSAFCRVCGSPIYKQSAGHSQFMFFHAGTLDDPSHFRPQVSTWTDHGRNWDLVDERLPKKNKG